MAEETTSAASNARQRKLGPAPIASFEDLSEDVDNGQHQQVVERMAGIAEVMTPVTPGCSTLKTPSTPRIDISRASSSSQQEESNNSESSPERELLAGGELEPGCKLSLGYKEDVQDLRSSTEELDLQDPIHEQDLTRGIRRARKRKEDGTQSECGASIKHLDKERNNSVCSEIILLNISGRTSRLSSVGSQGSGISGKLSAVSNASSRSPSPHKCMLETSFCGSKLSLTESYIEPKVEAEDLEKILLQREADTTKVLIPESIKIPIIGGNLKPDPLDKPRLRGREERKEIFKREVEITKKVLEKVNIQVPIIKTIQPSFDEPTAIEVAFDADKPASYDLEKQKAKPSPSTGVSPRLERHSKVRDRDESRTPSPCSTSRKSSFASLFKGKLDANPTSPDSPSTRSNKPRKSITSITSKVREATESIKSVALSRSADKGSTSSLKKDSKNKGVFSSKLSLFRKKERKKSDDGSSNMISSTVDDGRQSLDSISHYQERFRTEDSVFINLHGDDHVALPSESVSIPVETPTELLDKFEASRVLIQTQAKIEVEPRSSQTMIQPLSSSQSHQSISSEKSQQKEATNDAVTNGAVQCSVSQSSSKESVSKKKSEGISKPKRRSKEKQLSKQSDSSFEDNVPPPPRPPRSRATSSADQQPTKPQATQKTTTNVTPDVDHNSSESERDLEIDFLKNKLSKTGDETLESKGLFYEESFEEDLPYVPTTLPLEKSAAVPIVPVKERLQDIKTIPIERPRSTTPKNPTLLDEFVQHTSNDGPRRTEKMKISLPREDSFRSKSPRRTGVANSFTEFAERVPDNTHRGSIGGTTPPPRTSPRGQFTTTTHQPTNWINFEEIPERRKTPKRIQTIPRSEEEPKISSISFVQPEECRCECHGENRKSSARESSTCSTTNNNNSSSSSSSSSQDQEVSSSRRRACNGAYGGNCSAASSSSRTERDSASIFSDSTSIDCSLSNEDYATQPLISPTQPFAIDLDVNADRSRVMYHDQRHDVDL